MKEVVTQRDHIASFKSHHSLDWGRDLDFPLLCEETTGVKMLQYGLRLLYQTRSGQPGGFTAVLHS